MDITIKEKEMTKEQVFKMYDIEYDAELWKDETVASIRKWFKWFLKK